MYNYFLLLLLGHILGDFYFQSDRLSKEKDEKLAGVWKHSAVYTIGMLIVTGLFFHVDMLVSVLGASALHCIIDLCKYCYIRSHKKINTWKVFLVDQIIHVATLLAISYVMEYVNSAIGYGVTNFLFGTKTWLAVKWIIALLLIFKPSFILTQVFLAEFKPYEKAEPISFAKDKKAGGHIGNLERLIMLIFLSQGQYTAIGFILTAKSIARYERITKDREFAEYYLLGTLISAVCVIIISFLVK